jgi:hypothetical protein
MQLVEFLDKNHTSTSCSHLFPFFVEGDNLPIIFASQFAAQLKMTHANFTVLDVSLVTSGQAIAHLETSFLGMQVLYWIRGLSEVDKKYRQLFLEYCAEYKGPHQCVIFLQAEDATFFKSQKIMVEIPATVNSALFKALCLFFKKKMNASLIQLLDHITSSYEKISVDQACMIITYIHVIGKDKDLFPLLERILESEQSLFELSRAFFAKDAHAFFALWHRFESLYSIPFWCTFWSEQIWRAYFVHIYMGKQQMQQARTISVRLPFSFLQKDWKKSNPVELKNAHNWLYSLDYINKNDGDAAMGLEVFYNKFFLNEFAYT